jgi:two-component system NtrC family response regulator
MPKDYRGRILVVEDEAYVRASLTAILEERGYEVSEAPGLGSALEILARSRPDVVLTDLRLGDGDGLELVKRARALAEDLPIVLLTGQGTIASAVACLKAGASDYLVKPADPDALEVALERAIEGEALKREVHYLRGAAAPPVGVLGESQAWRRTLEMVDAAASTATTVLLRGESGTGKELLARRLHERSSRADGPLVKVNCAAVPIEMWESEFFGHRKGAFTGAIADSAGRFQLAHKGTLFLDEIGATPAPAQAKLLRAIEGGEFQRLGDQQATKADVRIVCATNADLEVEIREGRFRADLYYRLSILEIAVPPLRERGDDITLLARAFAREVAARMGRPAPEIDRATAARLLAYPWPGNVRELRSVLERALVLHPGRGLAALDLAPEPISGETLREPGGSGLSDLNLRDNLNKVERALLIEAHRRAQGVRRETARLLGMDPRNLAYYFHKHGLDPATLGE